MVSAYDPIESFFNSIQDVLSPLELRFQKAAKDFECCWGGSKKKDNRVESIAHFSGGDKKSGVRICNSKKKNGRCVFVGDERKKGLSIKVPIKALFAIFSQNSENGHRAELTDSELKDIELAKEHGSRINSLQYAVTWSLLVNSFVQAFPGPCESGKKWFQKANKDDKLCICSNQKANKDDKLCICSNQKANKDDKLCICSNQKALADFKQRESKGQSNKTGQTKSVNPKDAKHGSLECLIGFAFDKLTQSLPKFGQGLQGDDYRNYDTSPSSSHFDHFKTLQGIMGCKADVNVFLGNMRFARVGSLPSGIVGVPSSVNEGDDAGNNEEVGGSSPQKLASGILSIPLSNVERLKSTLSTVSLTELIDLVQQMGRQSKDHPDKKKLFSVQDFFRYTEAEGMRFFEELDRDGDGHVTLEDLEVAMRRRKLPKRYANDLMRHTRSHIFSKSFGWKQFLSLMEQKEATILRAYTSLCLSESGMLHKSEILLSLKNAGLPSNEDNAVAVMRFLNADSKGSISYGHFRNFMLLLPSDRLQDDPQSVWFEAATVVAVPPPVEIPAGSVLRSALAGGLSCALSTALMHPVDTIKTRVQASTLSFPEIIAKLPQIGVQGLYRGSIPAILGQFSSHGLRTGIFEASRLILINFAPTLPDIQVQSLLSFCSTVLGTAMRIPCEVLKQRCQAGIFDNAGEAILGTWHQDGLKGFFRGTGATLCREVPFYVAGMGLYAESKKAVQLLLKRELEPWETVLVGALSGGLASVVTTPFDVMKTRMMTAPQGRPVSMSMVAFSILRHEGPLGLFKGAVPRFFWIAPLGAMNFAGYELLKKAMGGNEGIAVGDQLPQERAANSAG